MTAGDAAGRVDGDGNAMPYKGLVPYAERDAALFFGRDRERELIEANLMASRLTVLYGPSGVGKTSVLHAGVIHRLRQQALHNFHTLGTPEFAVVAASQWAGDPVAAIEAAVHQGVLAALGAPPAAAGADTAGDLVKTLQTWGERLNGELLIVLDQFEEYFLYHAGTPGDARFVAQFARAVSDPSVPARFLISLREDALAQLDRFKGRIDGLFDNTLRIDRLDRDAARRAIEGPIERVNAGLAGGSAAWTLEPGLVDEVLVQVQTGRVVFGAGGPGSRHAPEQGAASARIDTPYLQLVMQRLWQEEQAAGSRVLQRATLARLGGAERIVRTHLDGVMSALSPQARETAHAVFHHLVTPSGMKIAHSPADLAMYTGQREAEVQRLADALSSGQARVLRPVASADEREPRRYEIHHDVLAAAILDWRQRYAQAKVEALAQRAQRDQRRAQKLMICAAAVPALMLLQFLLGLTLAGQAETTFSRFAALRVAGMAPPAAAATPAAATASPLAGRLKEDIAAHRLAVAVYGDRTRITVPGTDIFASGDARLSPDAMALFKRIGEALQASSGQILVTGHTDNLPIRSVRFPSNWHLSKARAQAVLAQLATAVPIDRLRAEGRADTEPLADNATAQGRARNRRIEIELMPGKSP